MPFSNQTKNLISKKEFEKMKDNVIIVNTARGGIINEKDLYWALKNRKIFGAGTDVYETEPPNPDNPLFTLDNILLSPHNAALTLECRKRMSVETFENIFSRAERFVFLAICTRPAIAILPNGENAHCTVEPISWWETMVERYAPKKVCTHIQTTGNCNNYSILNEELYMEFFLNNLNINENIT